MPLAHAANTQYELDLPDHTFVDSAGLKRAARPRESVYSPGVHRELLSARRTGFVAGLIEIFGADTSRYHRATGPLRHTYGQLAASSRLPHLHRWLRRRKSPGRARTRHHARSRG